MTDYQVTATTEPTTDVAEAKAWAQYAASTAARYRADAAEATRAGMPGRAEYLARSAVEWDANFDGALDALVAAATRSAR